jgi:hypothetical protein
MTYVLFNLTVLSPVSAYWTLSFEPQQCINETAHLLAGGIINTSTDFCVVLIPIPVVMRLRLPLRQRIYCALLFGAGFIICIAGSFRIAYTYELNTTYDKTWLAYPTWISGTIELYLGIVSTSNLKTETMTKKLDRYLNPRHQAFHIPLLPRHT